MTKTPLPLPSGTHGCSNRAGPTLQYFYPRSNPIVAAVMKRTRENLDVLGELGLTNATTNSLIKDSPWGMSRLFHQTNSHQIQLEEP